MNEAAADMPRFELRVAVQPQDIDEQGHVNNTVYLRWVQEIAIAHWRAVASAEAQAQFRWVVLRHEVDYKAAAFLQDEILVRTWVGAASRLTFERHTEIMRGLDGTLLAKARTLWCPVHAGTGRPARRVTRSPGAILGGVSYGRTITVVPMWVAW